MDFETAKASSRAVAEKRKAKGKGRDGHEIERGGDGPSDGSMDRTRPVLGSLHQSYDSGLQSYTDGNNGTGDSFIRTSLSDGDAGGRTYALSKQPEPENKYAAGTTASEDPFTPSQFMNLDAELQLKQEATSNIAYPDSRSMGMSQHASNVTNHPTGLSSDMPYGFGHNTETSNYNAATSNGTRPSLATASLHPHGQQSFNSQLVPETAYRVDQGRAGTYYATPSDDSSFGVAPAHYPRGASTAIIPETMNNAVAARISMDLSPSGLVDRDFLLQPSATHSTAAVHGNPSTGGTEDLVNLPIHTLTSKTLGEVGAPYMQSRVADSGPTRRYDGLTSGNSPDELLEAQKNSIIDNRQGIAGPPLPTYQTINVNPLDAIIPRPLLHHIINLFFDYVYPLTPCLHKPTFIQDLARQREMDPGQGEWTALVLTTVMSTLVQVPRAFVPLTRREVKDLAYRCHVAGRNWSIGGYKDFTVNAGMSFGLEIVMFR